MYKNKFIIITLIGIIFLISCTPKVTNNNVSDDIQVIEKGNIIISPTIEIEKPTKVIENIDNANSDYSEYKIITLLPFDAIQAIDNPVFLTAEEADSEYSPSELVIGVSFNGVAKAYSINLLSRHEIVNDTVGGIKLSATW